MKSILVIVVAAFLGVAVGSSRAYASCDSPDKSGYGALYMSPSAYEVCGWFDLAICWVEGCDATACGGTAGTGYTCAYGDPGELCPSCIQ